MLPSSTNHCLRAAAAISVTHTHTYTHTLPSIHGREAVNYRAKEASIVSTSTTRQLVDTSKACIDGLITSAGLRTERSGTHMGTGVGTVVTSLCGDGWAAE